MSSSILIYGATGYTGKLLARMAKAQGLNPILAGRNSDKLQAVAKPLNLTARVVDLDNPEQLGAALADISVVIHAAGPFAITSKPMLDACLRTGTHYLDITGEISVFEACALRDKEAKAANILVMPGVGFDVVPSDCLAAHLKQRLPDATELTLGISGLNEMSRGTAKTGINAIGQGTLVRRNGRLEPVAEPLRRRFDFGAGPVDSLAIAWGDVATAYHSTGIPNLSVYFASTPELEQAAQLGPFMRKLLSIKWLNRLLQQQVDKQPEGPSDEQRAAGSTTMIGEVSNAAGTTLRSRLVCPEAYTLTYMTALTIAQKVLAGDTPVGFQTPAMAFGSEFITRFDGVKLEDL